MMSMANFNEFCNMCGYETRRNPDDPIYKGDCPYHQKVLADGSMAWDEFNQDGEEW
jgi:hypothetical protein